MFAQGAARIGLEGRHFAAQGRPSRAKSGLRIAGSGKIPIFVPEETRVSNTIQAAAVGGAAAARTGKVV